MRMSQCGLDPEIQQEFLQHGNVSDCLPTLPDSSHPLILVMSQTQMTLLFGRPPAAEKKRSPPRQ